MSFPDPRVRLAQVIHRPRLVAAALATALLLVPLAAVGRHLAGSDPDSAALAAATPSPTTYTVLTSDADFARGTETGIAHGSGSVHLGATTSTRTWAGTTYRFGSWSSPWVSTAPFTQLIPSWTASTPPGSWIQVLVQVRDDHGTLAGTKDLGRWSTEDRTFRRSSAGAQSDDVARVATDTLVATGRPLTSYRLTVRLMRTAKGASPSLTSLGVVTSKVGALPATSKPLSAKPVSLAVPGYSQMIHRGQDQQYGGGGEAWCSPTSLSMVLGYYGKLPSPKTYAWVPRTYTDRWVNHVARMTYDNTYEGNGNWPFNTAYAASRAGTAFVTRLTDLRMAERFLRAGIPLVLSIRFAKGQLTGAPISATAGHLVVLTGLTASGRPIVNDPAAARDSAVRRSYDRGQFERAWLRGSGGMAYVVRDLKHPLPARPSGTKNW